MAQSAASTCPGRFSRHTVSGPAQQVDTDEMAAPGQPAGGACPFSVQRAMKLAETAEETRLRWHEWSAFALSSTSTQAAGRSASCSSDDDSDDAGPPRRHPLELAATERFLAADLRRRVCEAQAEMTLTIEEKIAFPAWMSWGRGTPALQGGGGGQDYSLAAAAPALCKMNADHHYASPAAVAATSTELDPPSPGRGLLRRGMHKVAKRLPNLRVTVSAALSSPSPQLPSTFSAFAFARSPKASVTASPCADSFARSPKASATASPCADSPVVSHERGTVRRQTTV